MRMTKSQFEQMLALLKTLTGQARKDLLTTLKSAEVYETDKDGNETKIEVEIVEKAAEETEAEAGETKTETKTAKFEIDAEAVEKAVGDALDKKTAEIVATRRKVFAIGSTKSAYAIPARVKTARTKNFKTLEGSGVTGGENAYRFGMWAIAVATGSQKAISFCQENGIAITKDQVEFDNPRGGVLVPEEFDDALIDLRLSYGVARNWARRVPMGSDTKTRMKRETGLTAYYVGEQQSITSSTKTWSNVSLTAKKLGAIAVISSELNEDAAIDIGDDLAGEIAYAFARAEDDALFNGDGTSTYGGIVGIRQRLADINGIDDGGGLVLATGHNTYAELTLADLMAVPARLPTYGYRPDTAWYTSPTFWGTVMQPLALAQGGVTSMEIVNGIPQGRFLGFPVRLSELMPTTAANSQIAALFGSMSAAVDFGDRRGTTIEFSRDAVVDGVSMFQTDQIAVKGTERFDINAHSVGDATNPGALVGLILAAS